MYLKAGTSGLRYIPLPSSISYTLYLVKGQAYVAGGKGWTTSDNKIATVVKKTGKITGKKQGTTTVQNDSTIYTVKGKSETIKFPKVTNKKADS